MRIIICIPQVKIKLKQGILYLMMIGLRQDTSSDGMRETLIIDLENYKIDGDIITFTETLNDFYGTDEDNISNSLSE